MAKKDPNAGAKLLWTDVNKALKQPTGFVRLKEGTQWTDPHKKAKKDAATSKEKSKVALDAKAAQDNQKEHDKFKAEIARQAKNDASRPKVSDKAKATATAAPKKATRAKAKDASKATRKTSSYGNESYAQHESFRKALEAGGGRAAWNASKQAEAGGAKVEISKPSSGTSLNAELDKFQASGGKSAKKDVKLGVVGRTGGKWHLGKKAGKG